jgi:DNA modification methylase
MKRVKYKREISTDWDFRLSNTKEYTHCYHNYPAMMIPQIARKLISDYSPEGNLSLIFDPYMGSGTTLVEAKLKGVNSIGTDINPLARLMSKVKLTCYDYDSVVRTNKFFEEQIKTYTPAKKLDYNYITNVDFWFDGNRISELDFLNKLINDLAETLKDFYIVALSECIREVSYTRNGEFKRYRIEKEKISTYNPDTFKLFLAKINRNTKGLLEFSNDTKSNSAIPYSFNTVNEIPDELIKKESVDMVITSPPYGDSQTTVAYGQYSRFSNEWFKEENAKNLDAFLMGGKKVENITVESVSLKPELKKIKALDEKRYNEVLYFLDDYNNSIQNVSKTIRLGGKVCYVVGNRTVKGVQIPLDYFTIEAFEKNGFKHLKTIVRKIPNKKMPNKTSPTNKKGENVSTMMNEFIVILEKKERTP